MKLIQTLERPVNGYWDGGTKQTFEWEVNGPDRHDAKGTYVRIGSWEANHWFYVAKGRTDKLTLSYAKKHLIRSTRYKSTFKYE